MKQHEAMEILKMGHNVYLTGSAGSGKTYLLNEYIKFLKGKGVGVGVTASTGVAATHMGGVTIHSWSGLGIKDEFSNKDFADLSKKAYLTKRFKNTTVLIIDEVSMLHSYRLDMVDKVCKNFKQNNLPFGGMQVVLCGDFFQLPPINRHGEEVNFIDASEIWNTMDLHICYLDEQHRHGDGELTKILNDIRSDSVGEETLKPLRKRYKKEIKGQITPTKLYTHNIDVDLINTRELDTIQTKEKRFEMNTRGNQKIVDTLKKSCLAPEKLILKKNALVMFVKNNFEKEYVNGTLGKIVGFSDEDIPIVKIVSGKNIVAEVETWKIEEDGKVKAEISQIPLRLAWAITIHKSQGMTLDAAEIDLSKSFVEGMGYVALSRVRLLDGLKLMGLNEMALKVNKEVLNLDKTLLSASVEVLLRLNNLTLLEKQKKQKEFLKSITPKKKEIPLSTYEETKLLLDKKISVEEMANRRNKTVGTIVGHLEKLIEQEKNLDLRHIESTLKINRLDTIRAAFKKTDDTKLSPVREILGKTFSYDELRLARLFLHRK